MAQIIPSIVIIAWSNFLLINIFTILACYFYIKSVMPAYREERVGEKAWKDCKRFRSFSVVFLSSLIILMIFWLWFPIPGLTMIVHPNPLISILLGVMIAIPLTAILMEGIRDAGKETMSPSKDTELFGGIYKYIRHPQMVGELPWFIIVALFLNSLFLVSYSIFVLMISFPIIIHYEEKDLVKRFGAEYVEYRKRTGCLFPKIFARASVLLN
jgi:protein-S-isoprenylcysteine O-methyltransferase Ste14